MIVHLCQRNRLLLHLHVNVNNNHSMLHCWRLSSSKLRINIKSKDVYCRWALKYQNNLQPSASRHIHKVLANMVESKWQTSQLLDGVDKDNTVVWPLHHWPRGLLCNVWVYIWRLAIWMVLAHVWVFPAKEALCKRGGRGCAKCHLELGR